MEQFAILRLKNKRCPRHRREVYPCRERLIQADITKLILRQHRKRRQLPRYCYGFLPSNRVSQWQLFFSLPILTKLPPVIILNRLQADLRSKSPKLDKHSDCLNLKLFETREFLFKLTRSNLHHIHLDLPIPIAYVNYFNSLIRSRIHIPKISL